MIKKIALDFGTIKVHRNFLVAELNEGILLDAPSNRRILEVGDREFGGRPYGYISHRVNSYAVDPFVYRESADFNALKAIAVISSNPIARQSAEVERNFYRNKGCFEIFDSCEEAVAWMNDVLADSTKN